MPSKTKPGVILVNLGTPTSPNYWSVRKFLSQFLADRRVIDLPALLWKPILYGVILQLRPLKSSAAYKAIWMNDKNISPLLWYTQQQGNLLRSLISKSSEIEIEVAMRYGSPSIESQLESLRSRGCDRICIIALFPQYSSTTSASVYDEVFRLLMKMQWQPAIRTAQPLMDYESYNEALCSSILSSLSALDFKPEKLLLSFHGVPTSYLEKGDPYYTQCLETASAIQNMAGFDEGFCLTAFQSKFGPIEWTGPHTEDLLTTLPSQGITKLAVVSPSFISDCIETLEELGIAGQKQFLEAGGKEYALLPCLNDEPATIDALASIVRCETEGWRANNSL